ncbi:MAG: adenylate/guanylate cyclase domain-containing protein, partial [Stappiaceae bacterium]
DGVRTKAVILYSDLRDSTALAETMEGDDYLALLNDYYECSASAAIDAGGEVLDFIGDAVLSIFPLSGSFTFDTAIKAASAAVTDSIARKQQLNRARRAGGLGEIRFGISCSVGEVMFGNIGVPTRLTFSVIGPAVNAAARIEKMTKGMIADALATEPIARICPENWRSIGYHSLDGMSQPTELFTWHDGKQLQDAVVA